MLGQIYVGNYKDKYYYVGKHDGDIFKDGYKGSGIIWNNILNKYGVDSVEYSILEEYNSKQEGDELEKKYIKLYRDKYKEKVVNIADGGQGGNLGAEINRKRGLNLRGSNNGMYGKGLFGDKNGMYGKHHENWNHGGYKIINEERSHKLSERMTLNNPAKKPEVKDKIRLAAKNQINRSGGVPGGHWYTNGIDSKCFLDGEQPDGWYRGRSGCTGTKNISGKRVLMLNSNFDILQEFPSVVSAIEYSGIKKLRFELNKNIFYYVDNYIYTYKENYNENCSK